MSPDWPDGWWASIHHLERDLWRGVEAQHLAATMRLVDDLQEQEVLENILEGSKPPLRQPAKPLHYLLFTPFRYRSPSSSRFRRAGEAGVWYGAEELPTACTELAYWRWRFLVDSDGLADTEIIVDLTFFQARAAGLAVDLTTPPWDTLHTAWTDPEHYAACQRLADACRERNDVQWIRYWSARKVAGHCAAVLTPDCLRVNERRGQQTWTYKVTRGAVLMVHGSDRLSLDLRKVG